MNAATTPRHGARNTRLLVVDNRGMVSHHLAGDLLQFVRQNDVIVANDAATLPASLSGIHDRTGQQIELRLAGRSSIAHDAFTRFRAVVFGDGDFHTATEHRTPPPVLRPCDRLTLGPLHARVSRILSHPRLIDVAFEGTPASVWEGVSRHGRPIQYAYVPEPVAIWDTWTAVAGLPAAFEAPSAGFILDWATLRKIGSRGATFATLTHAAGISSTGDPELDRCLPFDEAYDIPSSTADAIAAAQRAGAQVIAIGTTVVRALEHSAAQQGYVIPGPGVATNRVGPGTTLQVVDTLVSGMHEPGSSHYDLLRAFQSDESLDRMSTEAERLGYRSHEFGDAILVMHDPHRVIAAEDQRWATRMTA